MRMAKTIGACALAAALALMLGGAALAEGGSQTKPAGELVVTYYFIPG